MMLVRLTFIVLLTGLSACGGSKEITCDSGLYLNAVRAPRVQSPEGLDNLEEQREMPLPEASPRPERPADAPCLEAPPKVTIE